MRKYINLILIVLAWLFSTVNTSGVGVLYNTPMYTNCVILFWFFLSNRAPNDKLPCNGANSKLTFFSIFSFILIPVALNNSWEGFSYIMMVPLVYCFSQIRMREIDFVISCYVIAALGLMTLLVYTRTGFLSGWNDNQIAMIGLFSYIYYTISLYGRLNGRKLLLGLFVSFMYFLLLSSGTESRSTLIFVVTAIVFVYRESLIKKYVAKKKFVSLSVSLPLIAALVVVLFPNLPIFKSFNEWSLQNYGKTAFNGRDILWSSTFDILWDTYLMGEGKFTINHHNSAMAVLGVWGIIGYLCWYKLFCKSLSYIKMYMQDSLVFGSMMAFVLIFWQQSFDLGFVNPTPNMMPYVILGLSFARIKTIKCYGND